MIIETKDTAGRINGFLMPIWNALTKPELRPDQVYMTAIKPGKRKGPHLHMKREGRFVLLSIEASVLIKDAKNGVYPLMFGEITVVPAGVPCALYNVGKTTALVLNMPAPAWSKDDQDDWPVETWSDPEGWDA